MQKKRLRVNVCKNKVMRCMRYVNVGQMYVRLNGQPLEEVDGFVKSLGSQVEAMVDANWIWYT